MENIRINNRYHILKQLGKGTKDAVLLGKDFEIMTGLKHPNLSRVCSFEKDFNKKKLFYYHGIDRWYITGSHPEK